MLQGQSQAASFSSASCARAIINARRISRVVYVSPYYEDARRGRDLPRGADILREAGLEVVQWPA